MKRLAKGSSVVEGQHSVPLTSGPAPSTEEPLLHEASPGLFSGQHVGNRHADLCRIPGGHPVGSEILPELPFSGFSAWGTNLFFHL